MPPTENNDIKTQRPRLPPFPPENNLQTNDWLGINLFSETCSTTSNYSPDIYVSLKSKKVLSVTFRNGRIHYSFLYSKCMYPYNEHFSSFFAPRAFADIGSFVYSCKNTLISLKMAKLWQNTSGSMDTMVFVQKQWYDKRQKVG